MRRIIVGVAAAAVVATGLVAGGPVTGSSATEVGDAGRYATWAGYEVGPAPFEALVGDFDENGSPDVAWIHNDFGDNALTVTLNLGDGTMSRPTSYPSEGSAFDGAVADLNGDGQLDVVVTTGIVELYLGDGAGNFARSEATGGADSREVVATDLDADGDPDLALTTSRSGPTVTVLINNGDATFEPEVNYPVGQDATGIIDTDSDGDGDTDLVVTGSGFFGSDLTLYPLLNDGTGTLVPAAGQELAPGVVDAHLATGDLDGDSDEDLVLAGLNTAAHYFLFNNGSGQYTPVVNNRGGYTSGDLETVDLEPDGDLDVLSATWGSSRTGDITVFRNNGTGTFTAEQLDSSQQPTGLAVADFNRDGSVDIAAANRGSSLGIIHPGGPGGIFPIPDQTALFTPPFKIASGDLDGDGDLDLASTSSVIFGGGDVQVLLNDGTGSMSTGPLLPGGPQPGFIDAADVDVDGDDDLFWQLQGYDGPDVAVALSNGDGTFAPPEYLNVTDCGPFQVTSGDVDDDGDPDLLLADYGSSSFGCVDPQTITVVPSNGDGTFGPAFQVATEMRPLMAVAADMNGDGFTDIVSAHTGGNGGDIAVVLNNGDGTFAPHVEIDSGQNHAELAVADLDGDGDPDLATVGGQDATVFLNDGTGTAFDIQEFPGEEIVGFRNGIAIDIGDIDVDGQLDIVVANSAGNDIGVWFNNGDGTFDPYAIHYGVNADLSDLQVADFNGDGLLDVAVPNASTTGALAGGGGPEIEAAAPNGVSVVLNTGGRTPPGRCTITGTSGADRLVGTAGPDVICGNAGNDVLVGGGGDDVLIGGRGDDQLRGQNGNDRAYGGDGRDIVVGGPGSDRLSGGAGPDRCDGGAGTDTAAGCERTTTVP